MIYSDDQVQLAKTVVRVPEVDTWCKESWVGVRCTPWELHVLRETTIIFKEKIHKGHGDFEEKIILARQPNVRVSDLQEHGMTRGWPKCDHFVKYQIWASRPHSNICRMRITAELAKTQAGGTGISAAFERLDKIVEEHAQIFRTDVPRGRSPR